jgi:hypothetical protein
LYDKDINLNSTTDCLVVYKYNKFISVDDCGAFYIVLSLGPINGSECLVSFIPHDFKIKENFFVELIKYTPSKMCSRKWIVWVVVQIACRPDII